jgi:hypothetical protein
MAENHNGPITFCEPSILKIKLFIDLCKIGFVIEQYD